MSRKKLESYLDFLNYEPYISIINVLELAPKFHRHFKRGLKPRHLRHLLVNGCSTDDSLRRILDQFRHHLLHSGQVNKKVKLDQRIAGSRKEQGFNKYLNKLKEFGWITRANGFILLAEKKKKEILQIWARDSIMDCPANNISPMNNYLLFHPNFSIKQEEKEDIQDILDSISMYIHNIFRRIGLRNAGLEWSTFSCKVEEPIEIKYYFWLKTLYIHYISSLMPLGIFDRENYHFKNENIPPVRIETIMALKSNNFEEIPKGYLQVYSKKCKDWQSKFWVLIIKALKRKYRSFSEEDTKKYISDFNKMCLKTLMIRIKSEEYRIIHQPEIMTYFYLKDVDGMDPKKAHYTSETIMDVSDPSENKTHIEQENLGSNFLSLHKFFDGFDNEIIKLGYKNIEELCDELCHLVAAFKEPD